jgi:retron-type reverse transcriptase
MKRVPIRGGNWNNGSLAGLGALNLNNLRSNVNINIGFRPALFQRQMPQAQGPAAGAMGKRSQTPSRERENIKRPGRLVGLRRSPPRADFSGTAMAKTHNHLWPSVYDFANLFLANKLAAKGKRYHHAALEFAANLEENLICLQNELVWGSYHPLPLREFWINDPKRRLISAPAFRDRVVHHAIVAIINPLFERRFIYDSHACRVGHGVQLAVQRIQQFARSARRDWGSCHFYKGDIKGYFPSIHHDVLKKQIRRVIADKEALAVIDRLIDTYRPGSRGLPIGALTSQLFANLYLDALDHHAKDKLGIRYYARYMDDFVVIGKDAKELRRTAYELERFCRDELALSINPKSGIAHGKSGISFCGFRIWPTHILPRRATVRRAARRLRKLARTHDGSFESLSRARTSIMSFLGYLKHCSARQSTLSVLNRTIFKGGIQ